MLTRIAGFIYSAYLAELRREAPGSSRRKKRWRRLRRLLLRLGDPDIVTEIDGFNFMTPFSSDIILSHFEFPFYDSVLPRLARAVQAARGSLVMLDIGANIGAATYLVAKEVPGRTFCIEANPRFKPSLLNNLAQIPGSRARFVALNDQPARRAVRHSYALGNSQIEAVATGGALLEFTTLDAAVAQEPEYRAPNLIKIDTEGFELKILRGATQTLLEHRPTLFFEFFPRFIRREGGEPDALFELLAQQGYDYFIFYDGGGNLLTAAKGTDAGQLQSLRRYCELRESFFDVAAFHNADPALRRNFESGEDEFFGRSLRVPA